MLSTGDIQKLLHSWVTSLASTPQGQFFDDLVKKIDDHVDVVASRSGCGITTNCSSSSISNSKVVRSSVASTSNIATLKSAKANKSSMVGEIFEQICYQLCALGAFDGRLYGGSLASRDSTKQVWFANRPSRVSNPSAHLAKRRGASDQTPVLPIAVRNSFALSSRDMGIDLIVETTHGRWIAIQVKYRRKPKRSYTTPSGYKVSTTTSSVPWKDLSTFYSLCERTGPPNSKWLKQVVMTNANTIRHQGRKKDNELSICVGTFRKIPKEVWFIMVGFVAHTIGQASHTTEGINNGPNNCSNSTSAQKKKKPISDEVREKREAFLSRFG